MGYIVTIAFIAIFGFLAAAGYYMLKGGSTQLDKNKRMARALGLRVAFSIGLFLCIMLAWAMGWIQPTGIH